MRTTRRRAALAALAIAGVSVIGLGSAGSSIARSNLTTVAHVTPAVVAHGRALDRGQHDDSAVLGRPGEPLRRRREHGDLAPARSRDGQDVLLLDRRRGPRAGCEYPAESQYVVAVGGTALNLTTPATPTTSGEPPCNNGGGCLDSEPRPSWQTGIGTPAKWGSSVGVHRPRQPTVARSRASARTARTAVPATFIFFDGAAHAASAARASRRRSGRRRTVIWNNHNAANGRPGIGFAAPLIYALANDPTTYARDFHDVTTGTNGFAAATGWDEATGWGSADFNKLANNLADVTYTGPTQVSKGDTITLSATLLDKGAATMLATAGARDAEGLARRRRLVLRRDCRLERERLVQRHDQRRPRPLQGDRRVCRRRRVRGRLADRGLPREHIPTKITYIGRHERRLQRPGDAVGDAHRRRQPDLVHERRPDLRQDAHLHARRRELLGHDRTASGSRDLHGDAARRSGRLLRRRELRRVTPEYKASSVEYRVHGQQGGEQARRTQAR